MLFTLAMILFVAWLLGLVGVYTIGSIVHLLLVIALVLFLVGIIGGRRAVV
ncbi:MAG: lmo0937 family membrane protein [Vicinamibacterales bacterium]